MMSKNAALVGILGILSVSSALADTGPCGDGSLGATIACSAMLITSSPIISTWGLAESTSGDNREMIESRLREDSAEFVASNGLETPSAFLNEAIVSVRENTPAAATMTDLQIAEILVSAQD